MASQNWLPWQCPLAPLDPCLTQFLRPIRAHNPNGISIGSAVLHRWQQSVPILCNGTPLPPSKLPLPIGYLDPHLIHGSLGPPESWTQMASRSMQAFLQSSLVWQTDRPTDHATWSVTIGHIYVQYIVLRCSLIIIIIIAVLGIFMLQLCTYVVKMFWALCLIHIHAMLKYNGSPTTDSFSVVSDIAVFVLKRDIKLQPTNQPFLCVSMNKSFRACINVLVTLWHCDRSKSALWIL